MELTAFTDGSSIHKSGRRYGGIGVYFPDDTIPDICTHMKGDNNPTNQRAELLACIVAIKLVAKIMGKKKMLWNLTIYSDSRYTIQTVTHWANDWIKYEWKRKVGSKFETPSNLDLVKKLYGLTKLYDVKYVHVRSHQREPKDKNSAEWERWFGNKQADKLAKSGCDI